jgi:hypothetical protein
MISDTPPQTENSAIRQHISVNQRRIINIRVAVPGLGVGGIDGGEPGGVGGRPAALCAILASREIVEVRYGVLIHTCEVQVRGARLRI